ncbi:serine hydrolase domain-containing protein [Spirilliplanes yamanashiensis]|uniref:Beta-lactamase-related domain-containing protein n=1 Tax=Spirilliplanes yamanashiensis TaxID=42233 RepID=A0A8J3YB31_9ACTN|nr:serine hydrolase domain-containing protein [Spirilliplanes yamanashiensis]MDP9817832.1 CubicO group peptidase (beta-lactamase class C family) [Spirilliplanes yamanashiensis]GIJ04642.1 hypothetical protein Sya03_39940 [Spirilliplanes yamanashiensis]
MTARLRAAIAGIEEQLHGDPAFAHVSHLLVRVGGRVVHDAHYRGPRVADTFSLTKSVIATLVGAAVREGYVPDLDAAAPGADCTWRQLLTMTRGRAVDGPWEIDAVMALSSGRLDRIRSAPRLDEPGVTFRYDNGAAHLLAAALREATRMPVERYAATRLFDPLGITAWDWPADSDGVHLGFGHLRLGAADLAELGELWLRGGEGIMDPAFARAMTTAQNPGGPPENVPYGYLLWVDSYGYFAGGWAGQSITVVPAARAVVVTTGDPRFDPGPPPTDALRDGWRSARDLVVERLIPVLA